MGFFSQTKKQDGWMAFHFLGDGVCVAHVRRMPGAPPEVGLATVSGAGHADPAGLQKLAREVGAQRYRCTTLLAPREYQMLAEEMPSVPRGELKTAMRWRIKDLLDYRADDAAIDVLPIPADGGGPGRSRSLYAVAAPAHLIRERMSLFEQAGVPLSVIDIPDLAQRNMAALVEQEGRALALLSLDGGGGLLTITGGGELYLSRRIDVPWQNQSYGGPEQRAVHFVRLTLELQRSLDYFERQFAQLALSRLVLAPSLHAAGLREHLAGNLYVPVETLDLDSVLDLSRTPDLKGPEQQALYFQVLGAALRQEESAQ